jgi:hypothetical protein
MAKSGLPPGGAASGTKLDRGPAAAVTSPPTVQHPGSASVRLTIGEAAAQLTLDDAIRTARSIQRDLENGRLHTPYPPNVQRTLYVCLTVFAREGDSEAKAQSITARLEAKDDPADTVLPAWA